MYCKYCGNELPEEAKYCDRCGMKTRDSENMQENRYDPAAHDHGRDSYSPPGIGFSQVYMRPEILEFKEKKKRSGMGCLWTASFLPMIMITVMGLAGWVTGDNDGESAFFVFLLGACITVIMLFITLIIKLFSLRNKPMWEGVVIKKKKTAQRDRHKEKHNNNGDDIFWEDVYNIYVRTDEGKKKKISQINCTDYYNYFQVGDRIRYHPVLAYPEKFDKSHDTYIFCACCGARNPIRNNVCRECGMPLFK